MSNNNLKIVAIVVLACLLFLFPTIVHSLNLGTIVKTDKATIIPQESAEFVILVWNGEKSSFLVTVQEESVPDRWTTIIRPNNFALSSDIQPSNIDLEYVSTPSGYVKAVPVKIIIKPPADVEIGEYKAVIKITGKSEEEHAIDVSQEREFSFSINIVSRFGKFNTNDANIPGKNQNTNYAESVKNALTGMATSAQYNGLILALAVIVIISIATVAILKLRKDKKE